MSKYVVYVDEKPLIVRDSLDEAKSAGARYVADGQSVTIEAPAAPAPTRFWRYDREVKSWVESGG